MDKFRERRIAGAFKRVDNLSYPAGHVRLFGMLIYTHAAQAPGWAMHRRWNCGLFCVHHVGQGRAVDPEGWHVTFANLIVKRQYNGFSVQWNWADTFRTGK